MKTCSVLFGAVLLALVDPLYARNSSPVVSEPIVITATRTAQTADETLASVTVITREDIERRQPQTLIELLHGETGLTVTNAGGPGKLSSVFLRGTETDHVLVLIDGVKVGSVTAGTAAFQDIPVELIERIEIVRGPRSSLYGSEAIGGVIQIFTRRGGGALTPFVQTTVGSHDTFATSLGVSGGGARSWFSVAATHTDTDGINACRGNPSAGCFAIEPDRDGYRNTSGTIRVGHRFGNGVELDLHRLRARGTNEFDGTFSNQSRTLQEVQGAHLRFEPNTVWKGTLSVGRNRDESDNYLNGAFVGTIDTRREGGSFQNDVSIAEAGLLTFGVDYQTERVSGTTNYAVRSRNNAGLYAQYQGAFGAHNIQASLREDDNEQFGRHDTFSVAWGMDIASGLRVYASHGTAFKAPTFNELYFPGSGNPALRPEESRSTEIGFHGSRPRGRWGVSLFQTDASDLIAFDASINAPANVDSARITGLETSYQTSFGNLHVGLSYTWLEPENRSAGPNQGKLLPRRAQNLARLELDTRLAHAWRIGATVRAEDHRYDDLANTRRVGGFATVDLRAEYAFAKSWRAQAILVNALDQEYETAAFFNQEGRSVYVTVRYHP